MPAAGAARSQRADHAAYRFAWLIDDTRQGGAASFGGIAAALNGRGASPCGGQWTATAVPRVFARLEPADAQRQARWCSRRGTQGRGSEPGGWPASAGGGFSFKTWTGRLSRPVGLPSKVLIYLYKSDCSIRVCRNCAVAFLSSKPLNINGFSSIYVRNGAAPDKSNKLQPYGSNCTDMMCRPRRRVCRAPIPGRTEQSPVCARREPPCGGRTR